MSLKLSASRPRQLQYAAGGLRRDLRLLEVDEALLAEIKRGGCARRPIQIPFLTAVFKASKWM